MNELPGNSNEQEDIKNKLESIYNSASAFGTIGSSKEKLIDIVYRHHQPVGCSLIINDHLYTIHIPSKNFIISRVTDGTAVQWNEYTQSQLQVIAFLEQQVRLLSDESTENIQEVRIILKEAKEKFSPAP